MAMSAAEYRNIFEQSQRDAVSLNGSSPDKGIVFAQIAAVWSYLLIEQQRMEIDHMAISENVSLRYRNLAEQYLNEARGHLTNIFGQSLGQAVNKLNIASNYAYGYVEQVRVDNQPRPAAV